MARPCISYWLKAWLGASCSTLTSQTLVVLSPDHDGNDDDSNDDGNDDDDDDDVV